MLIINFSAMYCVNFRFYYQLIGQSFVGIAEMRVQYERLFERMTFNFKNLSNAIKMFKIQREFLKWCRNLLEN